MQRHLFFLIPLLCVPLGFAFAATSASTPIKDANAQAFLAENDIAMNKMMADMEVVPTGDVDKDFVAMMVPHHQGAIEMAQAVLRYGRNEQLRRIAQEVIVEQQQEIAAMRLALGQPLPPSYAAPTGVGAAAAGPAPEPMPTPASVTSTPTPAASTSPEMPAAPTSAPPLAAPTSTPALAASSSTPAPASAPAPHHVHLKAAP